MARDPKIDDYIAARAEFARPILAHLRGLVHAACPDAVEEIKWGMPFFTIGGRPLANMAAFKAHASFGFWRRDEQTGREGEAMGQFGRLTRLADLPDDATLIALIQEAVAKAASATPSRPRAAPKAALPMPEDLATALDAHPPARTGFDALAPGQRREYLEWIEGAKRPETRAKRIAQTIAQAAEGRKLNWKYENC